MIGEVIAPMRRDLQRMGVREGDCLIVHSSFKALGLALPTPTDVIRTLIETVGREGTVMTPTFTYCYSGIWGMRPYNSTFTPSVYMGIIPETLRFYPGALRSQSPTYSVAAIGMHAKRLTEGREDACGLGAGSSYEEAYKLGARILLVGVGNDRNSMLHYAEYASGLPISDIPYREFWGKTALADRSGETVEVEVTDFPGCSANFRAADELLEASGLMTRGRICRADSILMDAKPVVDAVAGRLREQPDWLFCKSIACEPCHLRRRRLIDLRLI